MKWLHLGCTLFHPVLLCALYILLWFSFFWYSMVIFPRVLQDACSSIYFLHHSQTHFHCSNVGNASPIGSNSYLNATFATVAISFLYSVFFSHLLSIQMILTAVRCFRRCSNVGIGKNCVHSIFIANEKRHNSSGVLCFLSSSSVNLYDYILLYVELNIRVFPFFFYCFCGVE